MSGKRKDSHGRVLKEGESQRKNGTYDYRYTDRAGNRHTVYAQTLELLREKEKCILRDKLDAINYADGTITLCDALRAWVKLRNGVRTGTKATYHFKLNLLEREEIGNVQIRLVTTMTAKQFCVDLKNSGYSYGTIDGVRATLKCVMEDAVRDRVIRQNPFDFRLDRLINKDENRVRALTEEEKDRLFSFIKDSKVYSRYLDDFTILLETGMRISELCGLTKDDIDLSASTVSVRRQLLVDVHNKLYLNPPKTLNGYREIPLSKQAVMSFQNVLDRRIASPPQTEWVVDGVSGFLFLCNTGRPRTVDGYDNICKNLSTQYERHYGQSIRITPHVFRHTFCTDLVSSGMDIKSLQYITGHAGIELLLNTYADTRKEVAHTNFRKAVGDTE